MPQVNNKKNVKEEGKGKAKAQAKGQRKTQTEISTAPVTRAVTGAVEKTESDVLNELVVRIRENVTQEGKFIQVDKDLKKVGPGLSLSGLYRVYKHPERSDFVYTQEFRFAGPSVAVDKILAVLGTSLAGQRLKNDIVDSINYENFVVTRVQKERAPAVDTLFTHDQISKLAQFFKTNKQAIKKEERTPKKKRAQRRKSVTGVQVVKNALVDVFRLSGSVASISEIVKQLASKQQGLDVSALTFEDTPEGLSVVGGRSFKIKARSKRRIVEYSGGHLSSETQEALETFLRRIGHSDVEIQPILDAFTATQSAPVLAAAPAAEPVAASVSESVTGSSTAKKTKKTESGVTKTAEAKKESKATARTSPKVTKAKTRVVKPRTSNE
jgi:hypothetical protein